MLIAFLTAWVMTSRPKLTHRDLNASADAPTVAQQHATRRSLRSLTEFRLSRNFEGPPFEQTGHTITDELQLRCAPCHQQRHAEGPATQ